MKMASVPTHIYQLSEYGAHAPRYVGKTIKDVEKRKLRHIKQAMTGRISHKDNWIRKVLSKNGAILIELLETVPAGSDWAEAEQRWIRSYTDMGCRLTNVTQGGDGSVGWHPSEITKKRIGKALIGKTLGVPKTPEHREKLKNHWDIWHSKNLHPWVGRHHKVESNQKVSLAKTQWHLDHPDWISHMTGRKHGYETKKKLRCATQNQFGTKEARSKHAELMRTWYQTKEGLESRVRMKEAKHVRFRIKKFKEFPVLLKMATSDESIRVLRLVPSIMVEHRGRIARG